MFNIHLKAAKLDIVVHSAVSNIMGEIPDKLNACIKKDSDNCYTIQESKEIVQGCWWDWAWNFEQGAWEDSLSRWHFRRDLEELRGWTMQVSRERMSKAEGTGSANAPRGGASLLPTFSALLISLLNPVVFFFLLTFELL